MSEIDHFFNSSENTRTESSVDAKEQFTKLLDHDEPERADGYLQAINDVSANLYKILSNFEFGKGGQLNGAHQVRTNLKKYLEHNITFICEANSLLDNFTTLESNSVDNPNVKPR